MKIVSEAERKQRSAYLRLLAYGMPGCGKTWLGASAADDPTTAPVLFVDYKGMSESLARRTFKPGTFIHVKLEAFADFNVLLTWLARGKGSVPDLDKMLASMGAEWPKTVVVDSITEVHRMEVFRLGGMDPKKMGIGDVNLGGLSNPQIQHWGQILNEFMLFADWHYRQIQYNVILTALQKSDYDDTGNMVQCVPAMQGQAAEQLPSQALTVMHMTQESANAKTKAWGAEEPWYCTGRTRSAGRIFARDHTGVFPATIPNPTVGRMAALLRGGLHG